MTRATHCRFCHQPGELIKGAHRECKNAQIRERIRSRNNIDPSRYVNVGDRGKCKLCDSPAEPLSKLNLCRVHMDENARAIIRKAQRKHMRNVRSAIKHKQPRVYVKPPQSQSLQRVRKAEKVAEYMPVLDTEAERARVAELLEKARREREECHISRFLDDRYCVLDGRR